MIYESAAGGIREHLYIRNFFGELPWAKLSRPYSRPSTSENVISDPGDSTADQDKQVWLQKFHFDGGSLEAKAARGVKNSPEIHRNRPWLLSESGSGRIIVQ